MGCPLRWATCAAACRARRCASLLAVTSCLVHLKSRPQLGTGCFMLSCRISALARHRGRVFALHAAFAWRSVNFALT